MKLLRAFAFALFLTGCAGSAPEPAVASSAGEPTYAQDYPATLQRVIENFGRDDDAAKSLSTGYSGYPQELTGPDWSIVGEIHRKADASGRSRAYVERNEEVVAVRAFFTAEKDEIIKKVGGSATFAARQRGADVELSGVVSKSLSDAIDKQLEKRLREGNAAHTVIDRHRTDLGRNVVALELQAEDIARGSYLVHIAMVEEKLRLRAMLEEAEQVKKTIDEYIDRERAFQGKTNNDADKKASEARIARMQESKALIDGALTQGRETEKKMEERVAAAQKRHTDAMTALLADEDKRAKDAGQKK